MSWNSPFCLVARFRFTMGVVLLVLGLLFRTDYVSAWVVPPTASGLSFHSDNSFLNFRSAKDGATKNVFGSRLYDAASRRAVVDDSKEYDDNDKKLDLRILLIDHYDSFTYNLADLLGQLCVTPPTVLAADCVDSWDELLLLGTHRIRDGTTANDSNAPTQHPAGTGSFCPPGPVTRATPSPPCRTTVCDKIHSCPYSVSVSATRFWATSTMRPFVSHPNRCTVKCEKCDCCHWRMTTIIMMMIRTGGTSAQPKTGCGRGFHRRPPPTTTLFKSRDIILCTSRTWRGPLCYRRPLRRMPMPF